MKLKSISRRVYRSILTVSLVSMIAMVTAVLLVNEDLERTMLDVEFAQEREFILANLTADQPYIWDTQYFSVAFVPKGHPLPDKLPSVFRGMPDNHYSAEIELGDDTYLVSIEDAGTGTLYVAKSITHFERRESVFQAALLVVTLIILALSLLMAVLSSRRIVRPLRLLSERISHTPVGKSMPRMETDYTDAELHSIAATFNQFLDELESFVRREQSLLSLASHELRTPIAVMSGALDVLEMRNQLSANDQATLLRIRRSCDEMRDNVNILLKLARREKTGPANETILVPAVLKQVIEDLKVSHHAGERITLDVRAPLQVRSDPGMVSMLLRNLVQNALQHTSGDIKVTILQSRIDIQDKGTGLSAEQQAILLGRKKIASVSAAPSGLGLYIVTLMAERLGWSLNIEQADQNGTRISLSPPRGSNAGMPPSSHAGLS
jgi:signal transduction histidine kinase